jgi:hypothetical protein
MPATLGDPVVERIIPPHPPRERGADGPSALTRAGVWFWGTVLTLLFVAILASFCIASQYVDDEGKWKGNGFIRGLYTVIHNNQTVVAAVVATLGVTWSWFFHMSFGKSTEPEPEREPERAPETEPERAPETNDKPPSP